MWLKEFEIAIIEKNVDKIEALVSTPVEFTNTRDMKHAQYLLLEASKLLHTLKDETHSTMSKLKKNIDFLKVSERKKSNSLDIRS